MKEYIATFCMGHLLRNKYVAVKANTVEQAREKMFNQYGELWAFMYESREKAGVYDFNLQQVEFGTPNRRLT